MTHEDIVYHRRVGLIEYAGLDPWPGGESGHLLRGPAQRRRGGPAAHRGRRGTRTAVLQVVVGDKTAAVAARFLDHLVKALRKLGITTTGVLTDNGPEFFGRAFQDHAGDIGLVHHRIPPRSPNHNSVCDRFHRTVLHEFYRPHFHRGRVDDIALLDRSLQAWLRDYNEARPNHGDYMNGRTPLQVKKQLKRRIRQTAA